VGPGESYQAWERNGLQLDWACGTSNREVVVETNAVVQWYRGLKMDENRDTYVKCNRFQDERVGAEFYRGGASPDPEVRLKENLVRSNVINTILVEEGMESLAVGTPYSPSDRGLNKIVVDNALFCYVKQNDGTFNPATQFLHAEQNHWFDGAVEQTEAAVILQCEPLPPSTNRDQIQADNPILTNPYNIACVPAYPPTSPPGVPGGGTIASWQEGLSPEERGDAETTKSMSPLNELPVASGQLSLAPNPGREETVLRFVVGQEEKEEIRIAIYDVQGRRVAVLAQEKLAPGWREVSWRGVNSEGKWLAAGVYFVRFEAGEVAETRKIVHLR
jgi:hypothetical protein